MFTASVYDPNLRLVMGVVQDVLFWSGGIVFGIIAGRMRPEDRRLQMIVCASIVFLWLVPYGRFEGVLLPIVPLAHRKYALRNRITRQPLNVATAKQRTATLRSESADRRLNRASETAGAI